MHNRSDSSYKNCNSGRNMAVMMCLLEAVATEGTLLELCLQEAVATEGTLLDLCLQEAVATEGTLLERRS